MEKDKEYKEFCNRIRKTVKSRFPEQTRVEIHQIMKNNSLELDSLVILNGKDTMSPNFYLQFYYEDYVGGKSIEELADQIESLYYETIRRGEKLQIDMSYAHCEERIVFRLVSYARNEELLHTVPYIRFLDMAVTFHVLFHQDDERIGSVRITNHLLALWKISREELFALARKNSMRLFPEKVCGMYSLMNGLMEAGDKREMMLDLQEVETSREIEEPYVLTNSNGINGATVILYTNTLRELGCSFGEDYYLLPSSIHEWLAIPVSAPMGEKEMVEMVKEVNAYCVAREEVLSDNVYRYDNETETIHIVEIKKDQDMTE